MAEKKSFEEHVDEAIILAKDRKFKAVRQTLLAFNAADVAEILEAILEYVGIDETIISFRLLPKDVSVEVFSFLPVEDQIAIIDRITDSETTFIIDELDFDDKIDVLEELPANVVDKILEHTPKSERSKINTFLNYPEDSAGTLMTPDYISLQADMTVGEALAYIKDVGMDSETIYTCYVKTGGRKLSGIVSLRTLVVSDSDTVIRDLMKTDFVVVNVYEDQEEVSEKFSKYGFLAIPVVDNEDRLVGIITIDDIFDVIEEEATEDIERMAGVLDSSDADYLDISVWQHVKNRFPWLFFLMCSYVITGRIIAGFEGQLSEVIALVAYMPMLMGTGGNSGSQSATLVIRGISVGNITMKDAFRVFWREFRVAILVGGALSALNFARIMYEQRGNPQALGIALTVCSAMLLIVTAAKCIGGMLPLLAKRMGIDPALMASPMIASMTDMVSVVSYFLLATLILGM